MEMVRVEVLPGNDALEKINGDEEIYCSADEFETDDVRNDIREKHNNKEAGFNKEKPPEDDCCPICFGEFKVPCKANCGHWFCGGCILQLWRYRARPRQCKCPFCNCSISKLTPEASSLNKKGSEFVDVLDNIKEYNLFYFKGINGVYLILGFYLRRHGPFMHLYLWRLLRALVLAVVITAPAFVKKTFIELMRHPDRIGTNFIRIRLIGCVVSIMWHFYHRFYQSPQGMQRLQMTKMRLFMDSVCIVLVLLPYALMMFKTWVHIMWLRLRIWYVRREVNALRAQETAVREHSDALRGQEVALEETNVALLAAVEIARNQRDDA
ncbi:hypothetical protein ACJIZ3_005151 [Penstemon smallii]|uniref:RING-type domain-containing protein n=1 Tax=Penstemon smallii TaxID=265156 RepID=A0ABD3S422_9LAMI